MFLKEVLEVVDSFPAREIIAMCMNSDWSGSTYIMEHEPDKYDNMYTGYLFHPISVMDFKKYFRSSSVLWGFFLYGSREQKTSA